MGQDLSNLSNLLGREAEDDRPIETSQLLVSPTSPALPSKPSSTSGLQTLLSSSPNYFYSCSHSNVISQPTVASHQNLLIFPKSGSESHTDSCTRGAWQQDILISSSSSEPLSSHNSSSEDALQRDLLIPWPWREYLFGDFANLSIDVLEEKKQVVRLLSQAHTLKHPGDREEEKVSKPVVTKEIWMKHYSSFQKILLVGEGDFSFSACLAVAFGSATNMIATSLDSRGYLSINYRSAMSNIGSLSSRGAKVMHGVDATEMASHSSFEGMTFDRIVFNFPHDGFFSKRITRVAASATPKTGTPVYGEC